ncbi:MAG: aspartate-semialdehyde dehydrogenase [Chlamydiales bacterium]|nr:aspartate-semialdehyde dehydrogenase [Chlamydiales bacterium]
MRIAIVGATGAVGREMVQVLEKRGFPVRSLRLFASPRSRGVLIPFRGEMVAVEELKPGCFAGIDIALFSAGKRISLEWAAEVKKAGALMVDNSSAFREDPKVPLIIPEINSRAFQSHEGIVSCPNCTTAIMLMALAPLHQRVAIKRIVASTYQAASGAGAVAMEELREETRAHLEGRPFERTAMPFPYAFNLFTHNSPLCEGGHVDEEVKMVRETKKILGSPSIQVSATCVRVPVLRAHSISLNVEFTSRLTSEEAYKILEKSPGVSILEEKGRNRFPMPIDASGQDAILCGRIREDSTQPNTLNLWVVGDQLLKGAALNSIQIAELLIL